MSTHPMPGAAWILIALVAAVAVWHSLAALARVIEYQSNFRGLIAEIKRLRDERVAQLAARAERDRRRHLAKIIDRKRLDAKLPVALRPKK